MSVEICNVTNVIMMSDAQTSAQCCGKCKLISYRPMYAIAVIGKTPSPVSRYGHHYYSQIRPTLREFQNINYHRTLGGSDSDSTETIIPCLV